MMCTTTTKSKAEKKEGKRGPKSRKKERKKAKKAKKKTLTERGGSTDWVSLTEKSPFFTTCLYPKRHTSKKLRVLEVQTPQIILNFPQKYWMSTQKLPSLYCLQGLYSNYSLITLSYFLNLNILYSQRNAFPVILMTYGLSKHPKVIRCPPVGNGF